MLPQSAQTTNFNNVTSINFKQTLILTLPEFPHFYADISIIVKQNRGSQYTMMQKKDVTHSVYADSASALTSYTVHD